MIREEPRLQIISDELWHRVKARQSAQSIGPHGTNPSKAGKPATTLLSGLLLCEDCGSRFIASDQYSYQCATRTYGGLSACSNKVRVKRARAEAAIVDYIAEELLSPEAVDIAKRAYQEAIRKELGTREHAKVKGAGTLHAEEAQLREMLRAGTLSPDVARAALDAVEKEAPNNCDCSQDAGSTQRRSLLAGARTLQRCGEKFGEARPIQRPGCRGAASSARVAGRTWNGVYEGRPNWRAV